MKYRGNEIAYADRLRGGTRPIILKVKIQITTPENARGFCTPVSPLILRSLLLLDSRVPAFQVSSINTCALARGDGAGSVFLVSHTQVLARAVQAMAPQPVLATTPH